MPALDGAGCVMTPHPFAAFAASNTSDHERVGFYSALSPARHSKATPANHQMLGTLQRNVEVINPIPRYEQFSLADSLPSHSVAALSFQREDHCSSEASIRTSTGRAYPILTLPDNLESRGTFCIAAAKARTHCARRAPTFLGVHGCNTRSADCLECARAILT